MRRDDKCPFLETKSGWPDLLFCAAGVNFCDVGRACELCRLCPLDNRKWMPACEFMEVFTFLRVEKGQQRWVEVRVDCRLPEGQATQPRCAACPAGRAPLPHGNRPPEVYPAQAAARHPLRAGL